MPISSCKECHQFLITNGTNLKILGKSFHHWTTYKHIRFFSKYTYRKLSFLISKRKQNSLIPFYQLGCNLAKFQENIPVSLAVINLFRRENRFRKIIEGKKCICSFIDYWLYFARPFCVVCNTSYLEILMTKLPILQQNEWILQNLTLKNGL